MKLEVSPKLSKLADLSLKVITLSFTGRYDVELYQRIEQLIEKKLPLFKTEESEVMLLMERVSEAQRFAKVVRKISCCKQCKAKKSGSLSYVSGQNHVS